MICLFIAGLIKIVMCHELFGPQSMHFDLESQIESHLTLIGPLLATQAGDRLYCLSTLASPDLDESPAELATMFVPGDLQSGLPARSRPSWKGHEKLSSQSIPGAPLAKGVRCPTS